MHGGFDRKVGWEKEGLFTRIFTGPWHRHEVGDPRVRYCSYA